MEIDEEIKDEILHKATIIVNELMGKDAVLMNIQIEPEYSQYDVLFSFGYADYGLHQRGILATDLIIGIAGFGMYGFRTDIPDTDPSYYAEKLGVHSNYLSMLFNEVRKQIKERVK